MTNITWFTNMLLAVYILIKTSYAHFDNEDDALFITPYLDRGDIEAAQTLSQVQLGNFPGLYSNAGFITVDRQLRNHMFFWHFPSQEDKEAPLLIWLNGGPGVSSMLGLLWKHGPLEANCEKYGDSLRLRNQTWVGLFSVVYVDNPIGTGYSFSEMGEEGYKLTQAGYTSDLYNFVLQFFKLFPEYKNRQFYISGQSYAGKYVPALAHKIHSHRHNETAGIPLTGIILGGPYFDPPTMTVAFFDYIYALGVLSYADMERHKANARIEYEKYRNGELKNITFQELFKSLIAREEVNLMSLDNYVTGKAADYGLVKNIMNSTEMRKAVHVGNKRHFEELNGALHNLYGQDLFVSTKAQMAVLLDNYKVLIYNGDYDVVVNSVMLETAIMSTNWSLRLQYNKAQRITWNTCEEVKGFYTQVGNFCRVVVHGAGHQTQHDMPYNSLEMVASFLKYGCIKDETVATDKCNLTNDHIHTVGTQAQVCSHQDIITTNSLNIVLLSSIMSAFISKLLI